MTRAGGLKFGGWAHGPKIWVGTFRKLVLATVQPVWDPHSSQKAAQVGMRSNEQLVIVGILVAPGGHTEESPQVALPRETEGRK